MAATVEKFTSSELISLRNELLHSGVDSWQAADIISGFLSGRGYGTNTLLLRSSLLHLEGSKSLKRLQEELEKIAFIM